MAENLSINEWVDHLDKEYMSTFIKQGGATVKFVVPSEETAPSVKSAIIARAESLDYLNIDINSSDYRFHMSQDLFFGFARQVDWRLVARKFILRLAGELNFRIDGVDAENDGNIFEAIAKINNLDSGGVSFELRPQFRRQINLNYSMSKDFRAAMTYLCIAEINADNRNYGGQPVIDWLQGTNTRISSVRQFDIYTPINRTTAHTFLESALYWIHEVGFPGTLLLLDNTAVMVPKRPTDGSRYYTRPMAMEHYELLRQFIDGADRFTSTIIITISNNDFLDISGERRSRGIAIYPALQTRIMDDVRGKNQVNPNAALIRLT